MEEERILKEILKMNLNQLIKVNQITSSLIEQKRPSIRLCQEEKIFLEEIVKVLQKNGKIIHKLRYVNGRPNITGFDYGEFEKAFSAVNEYIEKVFGKTSLPRKIRFYSILASSCYELLVEEMNSFEAIQRLDEIKKILENTEKRKNHLVLKEEQFRRIMGILSKNFSDRGIGIKLMLKRLQNPEEIIDNAFPGYGYNSLFMKAVTN